MSLDYDGAIAFLRDNDSFRIVAHTDADGLTATSIMKQILSRLEKEFSITFLDQASSLAIEKVDGSLPTIFLDMGGQHLEVIQARFDRFFIVDHHKATQHSPYMLNPSSHGLDGTRYACTASLCWKLSGLLGVDEGLAPIALIGAQADNQLPFTGLNKEIVEGCSDIKVMKGARLYGVKTKPLSRLLAYSYDLQIKDLMRNPRAAERLLRSLGIENGGERLYCDLSSDERGRLDSALIDMSPNPDVQITHYTLERYSGSLSDTREAATLINACGKLGKPELALEILESGDVKKAASVQREYKRAVRRAHEWYEAKGATLKVRDVVVLNAKESIPPLLAGTICSVLTRGNQVPRGTAVICLSRCKDGTTKVSSRASGGRLDLGRLMSVCCSSVGGEGGGHRVAAGGVIPSVREDDFIMLLKEQYI